MNVSVIDGMAVKSTLPSAPSFCTILIDLLLLLGGFVLQLISVLNRKCMGNDIYVSEVCNTDNSFIIEKEHSFGL